MIFLQIKDSGEITELSKILEKAKEIRTPSGDAPAVVDLKMKVNLKDLLPVSLEYWYYRGGLTSKIFFQEQEFRISSSQFNL